VPHVARRNLYIPVLPMQELANHMKLKGSTFSFLFAAFSSFISHNSAYSQVIEGLCSRHMTESVIYKLAPNLKITFENKYLRDPEIWKDIWISADKGNVVDKMAVMLIVLYIQSPSVSNYSNGDIFYLLSVDVLHRKDYCKFGLYSNDIDLRKFVVTWSNRVLIYLDARTQDKRDRFANIKMHDCLKEVQNIFIDIPIRCINKFIESEDLYLATRLKSDIQKYIRSGEILILKNARKNQ
jgi:hypothetical protein